MTLLGVGDGGKGLGGSISTTTLGGIGAGYIYADWKEQIAYTTPNMNGFQATAGVTQGWNVASTFTPVGATSSQASGSQPAFEGKASYDFSTDAVKGKVWVSGLSQKIQGISVVGVANTTGNVADIGAAVSLAGFGLTGYYYSGSGVGTLGIMNGGCK